jgi:broad specificity phosphatase PhoE
VSTAFFVTHPEVVIDPDTPVPGWHLSETGIARMRAFAASSRMRGVRRVWCSDETKAVEAAEILADGCDLTFSIHAGLRENDRSATGFLPSEEFEQTADRFFAEPESSVRGWERASDAQERVHAAFLDVLGAKTAGDIAIVAHGAVGTLLFCRLAGLPIDRKHDQPSQGYYWAYSLDGRAMLHPWRSIDER